MSSVEHYAEIDQVFRTSYSLLRALEPQIERTEIGIEREVQTHLQRSGIEHEWQIARNAA